MVFLFLKFIYFSESSVIAGVAKFVIHFENNNTSDQIILVQDSLIILLISLIKVGETLLKAGPNVGLASIKRVPYSKYGK